MAPRYLRNVEQSQSSFLHALKTWSQHLRPGASSLQVGAKSERVERAIFFLVTLALKNVRYQPSKPAIQGRADFFCAISHNFQKSQEVPTSALIEIDRISEALGNQARFRCREDATNKKLKKSGSLGTF